MLKSELVISEDLSLLNSYLKDYSAGFLPLTFSDENRPSSIGYKNDRLRLLKFVKDNPEELRNNFIPHILKESRIFVKINSILAKDNNWKEWNIDPLLFRNLKAQIGIVNKIIEDCCVNATISYEMINRYYFNSLQLLVYFTAIRSSVVTIRNLFEKFNHNDDCCVLKFVHTKEASFTIIQQKIIIDFVENVFSGFFSYHLENITVEFDTGSPILEFLIKVIKKVVSENIGKIFANLFKSIKNKDKNETINNAIQINDLINESQKVGIIELDKMKSKIKPEDYEDSYKKILDNYDKLRQNNIKVTIDYNSKTIENNTNKLIEEPIASHSKKTPTGKKVIKIPDASSVHTG